MAFQGKPGRKGSRCVLPFVNRLNSLIASKWSVIRSEGCVTPEAEWCVLPFATGLPSPLLLAAERQSYDGESWLRARRCMQTLGGRLTVRGRPRA